MIKIPTGEKITAHEKHRYFIKSQIKTPGGRDGVGTEEGDCVGAV